MHGTLHLIPVPLGTTPPEAVLPASVIATAARLDTFVAENAKTARAFLKQLPLTRPLQEIDIREFDAHKPEAGLSELLAPLLAGKDIGLVSEAGCPAIADPGALLVREAHRHGLKVQPSVGPSSILLALMASGLDGQSFAFNGYLPVKDDERQKRLKDFEARSRKEKRTEIFIETPYRNDTLLTAMLRHLAPSTRLCVASNLTLPDETVLTQDVTEWKQANVVLGKIPCVYLFLAA